MTIKQEMVPESLRHVLRERWKITVHPSDGSFHCLDLETSQTALTDRPLIIRRSMPNILTQPSIAIS